MPLFVPIKDDTLTALRALARRERRRPQEQAAVLIERALNEADNKERRLPREEGENGARS